ncbi:MAG TPA: ADOP family duplicated permease [Terriglobales bacterium]|nr:ADOP family duplicated permease [Terriglobales bacterium]
MALARELRRGGRFAALMVAMLALGIGATTAVFSVVNGVLLQPLAFHDPGQLLLLGERIPQIPLPAGFNYVDNPAAYNAWRRQATDFSALAALGPSSFTLATGGAPRLLHGAHVTPNFFDLLGVRPQLGRLLAAGDENDTTRPLVITDQLWRSAFNADPGVIGRHVGVAGAAATVVGVLPPSFHLQGRELGPMLAGEPTEFFDALKFQGDQGWIADVFSDFNFSVIGRLRPGVTRPQALAQLNVIQANLARTSPDKLSLFAELTPVRDYAVAAARQELWLVLAGVLAVLLIVCVNLGGLWLTRLADRRRDWAIRAALGATPGRLARQVLLESLALALVGGGLGIAAAAAGFHALLAAAPANLPRLAEVHLDWRVAAFGLLLSLLAGVLTGVVPALRLSRADPQASLKAAGAATTADRSSLRSRQSLIALQASLATLLLAAASLLGFSFYRLLSQPTGFLARHALAAQVVLNAYSDPQRDQILRQLPAAAAAVPGVTQAAFTSHLPLQGETWIDDAGVPGKLYPAAQQPHVNVRFISPGYFASIGIPLLAGRDLAPSDRPAGWPPLTDAAARAMPGVVVLSRACAQQLFPGASPRQVVGRRIAFNGGSTPTVIAVAADARDGSLTSAPPSVVYQPYWQQVPYAVSLVVRSALPAASLAAPLRAAIWRLAPAAPIPTLRPLAALAASAVAPQRYQFLLIFAFALVALLLAALGVYALVAHSVARRAKELAIRVTLGARAADLGRLVLRQALAPVLAGVLAGLAAAFALGRLLAALLFQVSPANPALLAAAALAVLAAAVAACALPALRAGRADPLAALRAD